MVMTIDVRHGFVLFHQRRELQSTGEAAVMPLQIARLTLALIGQQHVVCMRLWTGTLFATRSAILHCNWHRLRTLAQALDSAWPVVSL